MKSIFSLAAAAVFLSSNAIAQSCDSSCGPAIQIAPQPYAKQDISILVMPRIQGYTLYEYQCSGGWQFGRRMVYNTSNEFLYSSAWLPTSSAC